MHTIKTLKLAGVIAATTLLLAACGGGGTGKVGGIGGIGGIGGTNPSPPPPGGGAGTLSGTMTPPQGGNLQGAVVAACDATDACNTANKIFKGTVTNNSYSITGLATGNYIVVAIKDNGDGQFPTDGDFAGCYGDLSKDECLIVQPPKTGLNFQVYVYGVNPGSLSAGAALNLKQLGATVLK